MTVIGYLDVSTSHATHATCTEVKKPSDVHTQVLMSHCGMFEVV